MKISNYDWKFIGANSLFEIKKGDKTKEGKEIPENLKGLTFTIGIATTGLDDIYTALYTFNVRSQPFKLSNIIQINSDQNTLCEINKENSYCNFMFYFNLAESANNLFIYVLKSGINEIEIYGKIVEIMEFDKMNKSEIENVLPRKNSSDLLYNSTSQFNKDYLYVKFSQISQKNYLLISVFSKNKTNITLMNTLRTQNPKLKLKKMKKSKEKI